MSALGSESFSPIRRELASLTRDEALSELWNKQNEFHWLQAKMASYPHMIPTFEEMLPMVAAMSDSQVRIYELKAFLGLQ